MIYICINVYFHREQAKVIVQIHKKTCLTRGKVLCLLFCELGSY